jgi:hypothetical protein
MSSLATFPYPFTKGVFGFRTKWNGTVPFHPILVFGWDNKGGMECSDLCLVLRLNMILCPKSELIWAKQRKVSRIPLLLEQKAKRGRADREENRCG